MSPLSGFSIRPAVGVLALRVAICALVFVHGLWRATQGGVAPFGDWLGTQGLPLGHQIAWAITVYELIAAPALAAGLLRPLLATGFAAIYATGMILVHLPFGWFVVGAGRNGMEYSALLILCFLIVGWTRRGGRG
jgi:putative oxidoreductase